MKLDREIIKNMAVSAMQEMEILPAYINAFKRKRNNTITLFINGGGYYIDEYTEDNLLEKIKQVEKEYGGIIYAVIKNKLEDDTVYSMLYVGDNKEDNMHHDIIEDTYFDGNRKYMEVFAYVYNASYEYNSEFGYITICPFFGGIRRVG